MTPRRVLRPQGPAARVLFLVARSQAYAAGQLARREGVPFRDAPNPVAVFRYRLVQPR